MALPGISGTNWVEIGGRDSTGDAYILRINADDELVIETKAGASTVTRRVVDPVTIPAAEGAVWTPALGATIYIDFEFEVVNEVGTTDVTAVDVGLDIGTTGASNFYFLKDVTLPEGGVGIRKGPYRMGGNDTIRANAIAVNQGVIFFHVLEEGTAT